MPDEPAPFEDTPTPAADTDWQARYQSLQPEYTRTTQALKDEQSVWEDEQAALARLAEKFPHLFEDESEEDTDPEDDDFDDPTAAELAAVKQQLAEQQNWRQEIENERGERRFNNDLQTELGDREVNERVKGWIKDRTAALGNNPKALKQAVEEWTEIEKDLGTQHLERVTRTKKATHVPPGGQPGTKVPNLDDPAERNRYLRQRAQEVAHANER